MGKPRISNSSALDGMITVSHREHWRFHNWENACVKYDNVNK